MSSAFALILVADHSPEFPAALRYGGRLARALGARVILARIVEPPDAAPWAGIADAMRQESADAADMLVRRFAADLAADSGVVAEITVREGEPRAVLNHLLEEDPAIGLIVLAAGAGRDGPGPLVSSLAKGGTFGHRPTAVLVVPDGLGQDQLTTIPWAQGAPVGLDPSLG